MNDMRDGPWPVVVHSWGSEPVFKHKIWGESGEGRHDLLSGGGWWSWKARE